MRSRIPTAAAENHSCGNNQPKGCMKKYRMTVPVLALLALALVWSTAPWWRSPRDKTEPTKPKAQSEDQPATIAPQKHRRPASNVLEWTKGVGNKDVPLPASLRDKAVLKITADYRAQRAALNKESAELDEKIDAAAPFPDNLEPNEARKIIMRRVQLEADAEPKRRELWECGLKLEEDFKNALGPERYEEFKVQERVDMTGIHLHSVSEGGAISDHVVEDAAREISRMAINKERLEGENLKTLYDLLGDYFTDPTSSLSNDIAAVIYGPEIRLLKLERETPHGKFRVVRSSLDPRLR